MIKLHLKFWQGGPELTKLKDACQVWFEKLEQWALWPLDQLDTEKCTIPFLKLVAWQRGIVQFSDEPERQFRLRTKYAFVNAKDAGSYVGFERIFARMQLGAVTIRERIAGLDWDIIELEVNDTTVANSTDYINWLIQTYGRTCRRYQWKIVTRTQITHPVFSFNGEYTTHFCS